MYDLKNLGCKNKSPRGRKIKFINGIPCFGKKYGKTSKSKKDFLITGKKKQLKLNSR